METRWGNCATYVQNWVFKHCTRKTFRTNKIKNMLDYINTWQDWNRKGSNVERCSKNLVASLPLKDDIRRQEISLMQIEVDGPKASQAENQKCSFPSDKSSRWLICKRAPNNGQAKGKGKDSVKNNSERGNTYLSMTRTRTAKWRDDLVQLPDRFFARNSKGD